MLSTDLRFLYLDPVLAYHLREQADALIGKSLLQFVHPDEQASAEQDLGGVLESRTLHGSVTRYVYALTFRLPTPVPAHRARRLSLFIYTVSAFRVCRVFAASWVPTRQ